MTEHEPPALTRLRDRVRTATGAAHAIAYPRGRHQGFLRQRDDGELLDPRELRGIVDYAPTELVVTVRAGTPLAELEALLAEHNQLLPFEPPHFGETRPSAARSPPASAGPRRVAAGSIRDFVLGASVVDGRGDVLSFGGRVMKNVAGYDMARVLAGSLGTLGVLVDVSLKVLPRPVGRVHAALRDRRGHAPYASSTSGAASRCRSRPVPGSMASLWLRLSGARAAVDAAQARLGGGVVDGADRWWTDLREQRHPFFQSGPARPLWRLAVPPTTPPLGLGATLIEWHGGQRWVLGRFDATDAIRARAAAVGGHATRFRGGDARIPSFQPLDPVPDAAEHPAEGRVRPVRHLQPGPTDPLA